MSASWSDCGTTKNHLLYDVKVSTGMKSRALWRTCGVWPWLLKHRLHHSVPAQFVYWFFPQLPRCKAHSLDS